MNVSIELNQINRQVAIRNQTIRNQTMTKNKTKICLYNFFSINEYQVCHKIQKIPYYFNFYKILIDHDFIQVGQLSEKTLEKMETILKNDEKIVLFKYRDDSKCVKFNDFLFNLNTPNKFIFHVLESYSYLLTSLVTLNDNDICFFNLSSENIVFDNDCGDKPMLQNFSTSLQINKLNEKYITAVIKKATEYTYKPLEVHVLFYLIENDLNTISYSFIEEITEVFIQNLSVLSLFSQNYKDNYKKTCINSLKQYINKSKNEIICEVLKYYNTWDNYSLSLIYLHIFGNITRVFSLKDTLLNKLITELSKNIHPDPLKRESLKETSTKYQNMYTIFTDWSYIHSLTVEQLQKLHQILSE